ncbi:MAG: NADH-quinone oxidoreductase subunit N [Planctomycetes bacterium RBG_13_62_9]|nr:MAG: NADH-quinone oxidoreductase subunit N [Planctomycetes bacterium RBG_13_62_9]
MTTADLLHILPLLVLAAGAVAGMLGIAIHRSHMMTFVLALCTLVLSLLTLGVLAPSSTSYVTPLIRLDGYAVFFTGLLLVAAIAIVAISYGYLRERAVVREEFYILTLTAMLGCVVLVSSTHFASFFVGLELLSVSLYILIAYHRAQPTDIEAGIKYFIPAATSSAFLLFGISLVYARTGTMALSELIGVAAVPWRQGDLPALLGMAMILIGIGFKLALVPFHFWAADVYEGSPVPVTALIATASKGAVFALLLRYFDAMDIQTRNPFFLVFTIVAIFTMFTGNYLALLQNNIKRLLAYSSIAHVGYLLVAFLAGGRQATTAVAFYLLAYFITTLGAFGVIAALSGKDRDLSSIGDYRGLVLRHPVLAAVLAAMMLSLAGIPLTAGFLGKFYVLFAGVRSDLWLLVLVLVANSVISLFYYLRVVITLYQPVEPAWAQAPSAGRYVPAPSHSLIAAVVLALLTLSLIGIGIYPSPVIQLIETMTK